jgi:hypothetical protein
MSENMRIIYRLFGVFLRKGGKVMTDTSYIKYLDVSVTLKKDGTAFADYPNEKEIVAKIGEKMSDLTQEELRSDSKRFRVYYSRNSLGRLFTDIENVMN